MARDVGPGCVAHFSDGQKVHSGIVLSVSPDGRDTWALFLTSNPQWNKKARLATSDELALCGFPQKKDTYIAPVVRPVQDASASELVYPVARIETLRKEFGPDPFAPLIFTLPDDIYPPIRYVKPQMPKRHLHDYIADDVKKNPGSNRLMAVNEIKQYLLCESIIPRSELKKLTTLCPKGVEFFCRRASITMSIQALWEPTGRILAEHLVEQKIPRKLLAARMGVPERDILAFETGLQCPSFQEMLTIAALLPEIPDEWSLPSSVPLLCDCISITLVHYGWNLLKASSATRIPYRRIHDILVQATRPTGEELKRLKIICHELPPWRAYWDALDNVVELESTLERARKGSGR